MEMHEIPFSVTDWLSVEPESHSAEQGSAISRTRHFGAIRVRPVDYSPGYVSNHWCHKGHVLFCVEGELHTELDDGRMFVLKSGMSYQVADNAEAHRPRTPTGARLFVVD